jgi:hypothetical protein
VAFIDLKIKTRTTQFLQLKFSYKVSSA